MRRMRNGLLLAGIGAAAAAAHGQLAVYGNFDLNHLSDTSAQLSSTFFGGGGGLYDDFIGFGPLRAGVDVRADVGKANNLNYRTILGGVRLAVKTPILPIRPYVQASVGGGGTKSTAALAAGITGNGYVTKAVYEVFGGLDYTLIPHLDFRVIEVGYGRQTSEGDTQNQPSASLFTASSGLVLRF